MTAFVWLYTQVRCYEKAHGVAILCAETNAVGCSGAAERPAAERGTSDGVQAAEEASSLGSEAEEEMKMEVKKISHRDDGESVTVVIELTERPAMEDIRRYVEVGPMARGVASISYEPIGREPQIPLILVRGDFAYGTNVTVRVRKGLACYDAEWNEETALGKDVEYSFVRKDRKGYVVFADEGRYLPPYGKRSIRFESMNVTNIATSIWRVEARNVVEILREDLKGVLLGDLSGDEAETNVVACAAKLNEKEVNSFALKMNDGGGANGIYLVEAHIAEREMRSWWDDENPMRWRMVCVTDLGLSVRELDGDNLGIWVTSLTTGKPRGDVWLEVYTKSNTLIGRAKTDANGWCEMERIKKGEAFAVVAIAPDDMSFISLRDRTKVAESEEMASAADYMATNEVNAFVWTERGIYRHDEKILMQAILRDGTGKAPRSFPVRVNLVSPTEKVYAYDTLTANEDGGISYGGFSVPGELPSGVWTIEVKTPGKDGKLLGARQIKVEEFAPPQIRVAVEADEKCAPSNFVFEVSAEHLYGAPGRGLACEGAVVFEDVAFAPADWKGYYFGNEMRGLKPSFRTLAAERLDEKGRVKFAAPMWASKGLPKAAVRATGQGTVFEDGGRPATARKSVVLHHYPYYIGSTMGSWMKLTGGRPKVKVACVKSDGTRLGEAKELVLDIEKVEYVYTRRRTSGGWDTWDCETVKVPYKRDVKVVTKAAEDTEVELPIGESGEYEVVLRDEATGASFGRKVYASEWGDDEMRAPLGDVTKVTVAADKAAYRVGDVPRLVVKSPFVGAALLTVMREKVLYTQVLNLTNATSEVELRPVEKGWAPDVNVSIVVVQSALENVKHVAARAHGEMVLRVRPKEFEVDVGVAAKVEMSAAGSRVKVDVKAPGATRAVVTLVDEGIHLLTGEGTPDPVEYFAESRVAKGLALYDLYNMILPIDMEKVKASGVKTGGGFGAEMLGRVSPVPTRRFKPLAKWERDIELEDGEAKVEFELPEFVGEVRVTALAYSGVATGAKSVQCKVVPKLVMQADAPRFVAPKDMFELTLPLVNRSGTAGAVKYEVTCATNVFRGSLELAKEETRVLAFLVEAPRVPGQMVAKFVTEGFGEKHVSEIEVPVRPAVAWRETAGCVRLEPGAKEICRGSEMPLKRVVTVGKSQLTELAASLEWLAEYPHGCLEQTASRIFPLITAGGIFSAVGSAKEGDREAYVNAGVRRVESMIRANDFVMWPDCNYAPWNQEVSLYAAHFLVEAERSGRAMTANAKARVMGFLQKWAMSSETNVSAYACHTLALAGKPNKDRMFRLYDERAGLSLLARARLARAFVAIQDRTRAAALLADLTAPGSIKEAAFTVLAFLELDPEDARILPLVEYLLKNRRAANLSWGTTEENAHALLALGAYYRHHPLKEGTPKVQLVEASGKVKELEIAQAEKVATTNDVSLVNVGDVPAFISWKRLSLPEAGSVTNEARGLAITRRFLTPEGTVADVGKLQRGEMLFAEISITSKDARTIGDLVIEDLFAGCLEPVHSAIDPSLYPWFEAKVHNWVLRSDARDDRMLVFSKRVDFAAGETVKFYYPVRVITAGDFVLPGPVVEAMYAPELGGCGTSSRLVIRGTK